MRILLLCLISLPAVGQVVLGPISDPSFTGGPGIDAAIEAAIAANELPGAVVLIGHGGRVVYHKAYGQRALTPQPEPMTLDTIFDAASLTKVVATTSSIMKLVESGRVRINDPVTKYIPEYQGRKSEITLRHLLTHYSGLRPDLDLEPQWQGYETGVSKALVDLPTGPPGARFVYSDINFILLGEIVRRVSGKPLPVFAQEQIFVPLGMTETAFQPPAMWLPRIAPTEIPVRGTEPLRGIVHDPTTRYMGGIAGHAGMFTTASDLSRFAQMMLGMGLREDTRIFAPLTVLTFTTPQSPLDQANVRGFGWDINSQFSGNRGDLFPVGSYGHTGFTGTSLWIDPYSKTYVILMGNSVHPMLRPAITPLRAKVANVAAAGVQTALEYPVISRREAPVSAPAAPARNGEVHTGIDVLSRQNFSSLTGKRVGLITNHTGLTRDGQRNIDVMLASNVKLVALFSPEHGIAGKEDQEKIGNTRDAASKIPVYSLYSDDDRRPTPAMLKGIDVLIFDIQDVGARFYTYMCTMRNVMEEAAKLGIPFVVLDRPNPLGGEKVEGPILQPKYSSFVGCAALPLRHGFTVGELAGWINAELPTKAKLQVVRMSGWQRSDWWDSTGLVWVDPSPNMRSLEAAVLYPGIGMLEGAKTISVGRGTDTPFLQIGAEWMKGAELANALNRRAYPGVRVYPVKFRPQSSNFAGKEIEGVRFVLTDREKFQSVKWGLEVGSALSRLYPGKIDWKMNEKLIASDLVLDGLKRAEEAGQIENRYAAELQSFRLRRAEFLLY